MRMLEAKLDQVPPRRIGPAQKINRILRHGEIIEQRVLRPVVVGPLPPRS